MNLCVCLLIVEVVPIFAEPEGKGKPETEVPTVHSALPAPGPPQPPPGNGAAGVLQSPVQGENSLSLPSRADNTQCLKVHNKKSIKCIFICRVADVRKQKSVISYVLFCYVPYVISHLLCLISYVLYLVSYILSEKSYLILYLII